MNGDARRGDPLHNFAFLAAARLVAGLCSVALLMAATRWLGVEGYGEYSVVITVYFLALTLGRLGIEISIVRDVAQNPERRDELLSSAVTVALPLAVILVMTLPRISAAYYGPEAGELVSVLALALLAHAVARPVEAILHGLEAIGSTSLVRVIVEPANALGGVAVLVAGGGVSGLVRWHLLMVLVETLLLVAVLVRRVGWPRWRLRWATAGQLIREGASLFTLNIANLALARLDILLLGGLSGVAAVGLYAPGVGLLRFVETFRLAAVGALAPRLSRWAEDGEQALARACRDLLELLAAVALGIALAVAGLAELFHLVIYGEAPPVAVRSLQILALASIFETLAMPLTTVAIVTRRLRAFLPLILAMVGLGVGLDLWWIPRWGALGAAAATAVTGLVTWTSATSWLRRRGVDVAGAGFSMWSLLARPALAGAVAVWLWLVLSSRVGDAWATPPALLAYLGLLAALGLGPTALGERLSRLRGL